MLLSSACLSELSLGSLLNHSPKVAQMTVAQQAIKWGHPNPRLMQKCWTTLFSL